MFRKLSLMVLIFLGVQMAFAADVPDVMLKQTSDQMIAFLKQNKVKIKENPGLVEAYARDILLPHVDMSTMSRLALGRESWISATPEQRNKFTEQFTTLMVRTYSTAMASYNYEAIQFKPLRDSLDNKDRVQIETVIVQRGGPGISVNYRLLLRNNDWKIYDLTVDGISMVQSFHSQFASEIARSGVDGLLQAMAQHGDKK
jgi:phospholipid transport system substrate-binding protein